MNQLALNDRQGALIRRARKEIARAGVIHPLTRAALQRVGVSPSQVARAYAAERYTDDADEPVRGVDR